jgi:hypothetical protein
MKVKNLQTQAEAQYEAKLKAIKDTYLKELKHLKESAVYQN